MNPSLQRGVFYFPSINRGTLVSPCETRPPFSIRPQILKKNFWKKLWEMGVFIYVRKLIRKTLREGVTQGISVKPDWLSKFNYSFSKEEKIEFIEKYKRRVEKLLPKIILFFESKYGNVLKDIEVGESGFSMEELKHVIEDVDYKGKKISLTFKFKGLPYWERLSAMNEMGNDLHYYFNIDVGYYGIPLELHYD